VTRMDNKLKWRVLTGCSLTLPVESLRHTVVTLQVLQRGGPHQDRSQTVDILFMVDNSPSMDALRRQS
jgi:hypothetical protein